MSENNGVAQPGVIRLVIEMQPNGQIMVTGPIQNRVLAYGLLETAKDVIKTATEKQESRIIPVNIVPKMPI